MQLKQWDAAEGLWDFSVPESLNMWTSLRSLLTAFSIKHADNKALFKQNQSQWNTGNICACVALLHLHAFDERSAPANWDLHQNYKTCCVCLGATLHWPLYVQTKVLSCMHVSFFFFLFQQMLVKRNTCIMSLSCLSFFA